MRCTRVLLTSAAAATVLSSAAMVVMGTSESTWDPKKPFHIGGPHQDGGHAGPNASQHHERRPQPVVAADNWSDAEQELAVGGVLVLSGSALGVGGYLLRRKASVGADSFG